MYFVLMRINNATKRNTNSLTSINAFCIEKDKVLLLNDYGTQGFINSRRIYTN